MVCQSLKSIVGEDVGGTVICRYRESSASWLTLFGEFQNLLVTLCTDKETPSWNISDALAVTCFSSCLVIVVLGNELHSVDIARRKETDANFCPSIGFLLIADECVTVALYVRDSTVVSCGNAPSLHVVLLKTLYLLSTKHSREQQRKKKCKSLHLLFIVNPSLDDRGG